ncbi:MAG: hypothetical protein LOD87_06660, partial [Planifilum fulgidum]
MKPKVKQITASRKLSTLASGWRSSAWVRFAFYGLIGIISYFLLLNPVLPKQYDLKPGTVSPETIVAPVTKIDQKATEQVREEAIAFCESMGFIMEDTSFAELDRASQEELLVRLPPFSAERTRLSTSLVGEAEEV